MAPAKKKDKRKSTAPKRATAPGMTRTLTQFEANPGSPELIAQVRADLEQHDLQAFFDAATMTPDSRQAGRQKPLKESWQALWSHPSRRVS